MTATGFDFEPLPNGDVLIDFYGDDGVVFNSQIITRECLTRLPVVVHAFFLAVEKGKDAALAFLDGVIVKEGNPHGGDGGTTNMRSGGDRPVSRPSARKQKKQKDRERLVAKKKTEAEVEPPLSIHHNHQENTTMEKKKIKWVVSYTVQDVIVEATTRQEAIDEAAGIDVDMEFEGCEPLDPADEPDEDYQREMRRQLEAQHGFIEDDEADDETE